MKWLQGLLKEAGEPAMVSPPSVDCAEGAVAAPVDTSEPVAAEARGETDAAIAAMHSEGAPLPGATGNLSAEPGGSAEGQLTAAGYASLAGQLAHLATEQAALRELFDARLRSDEVQGKMLERLHDELQQYKGNFVRQSLIPLLKEAIFCHDFVVQQADKVRSLPPESGGASPASTQQATQALEAVRQMLVDLLFKFDVEPYRGEGELFDPRRQQCLRTIPTDQPELDRRVAALGAIGFQQGEAILRREHVSVYKYLLPATSAEDTPPPAS